MTCRHLALLLAAPLVLTACLDDAPGDVVTFTWELTNADAFDPPITAVLIAARVGEESVDTVVPTELRDGVTTVSIAVPCAPGPARIDTLATVVERADGHGQTFDTGGPFQDFVRCGEHVRLTQRLTPGAFVETGVPVVVSGVAGDVVMDASYVSEDGALAFEAQDLVVRGNGGEARTFLDLPCAAHPDGLLEVALADLTGDGAYDYVPMPRLTVPVACATSARPLEVQLSAALWYGEQPADGVLAGGMHCRPTAKCDPDAKLALRVGCERDRTVYSGIGSVLVLDDLQLSCRSGDGTTTSVTLPPIGDAGALRPSGLTRAFGERLVATTSSPVWTYRLALDPAQDTRCTVIARAAVVDHRALFDPRSIPAFLTPTFEWRMSLDAAEGCTSADLADPARVGVGYRGAEIRGWREAREQLEPLP